MDNLSKVLNETLQATLPSIGKGQVANYIPALANINPNQLGVAIADLDGKVFKAGDADIPFSIQSISKLFTLIQAMKIYGEAIWKGVRRDPSGLRFNSLVQLESEHGIPRNPFINAGALKICDQLESRCSTPNFQLLSLLKELSHNNSIKVNHRVAISEIKHGARNAAMAYLMKAFDNFENSVEKVLESYAHHCAIEMSCVDLARATLPLANKGKTLTGKALITTKQCKRINALLVTCGLYDEAGEFAFRVGLPGKSGVGGGIVAIYPGKFSLCVWSPELNKTGNSLAGFELLERLTGALEISIF
ncbi:glutaminase B [Pleionea sediminis]|uniref:glutaminase B n=1 Tax=Pleionea sediminis TaxID=2569479 RepID=UPI0011854EB7|nr:glutaminase B [Pleionea sediminis]